MSDPSKAHRGAARHLLRYLAVNIDFNITRKQGGFKLTAFSDAKWSNDPENGRATSSYDILMCNGPVSFIVACNGLRLN